MYTWSNEILMESWAVRPFKLHFKNVRYKYLSRYIHNKKLNLEDRETKIKCLPCPFSKIGKNFPNLEKKYPGCGHLWVKFLIWNEIVNGFLAKKP